MSCPTEDIDRIFFEARLSPHRSLSARGFRLIMSGVVAFSLVVSTGLYVAGAWPVFGFLGADVVLVYWALRASFRSARTTERLELNTRQLVVERIEASGRWRRWTLQPTWLRVELAEPVMPSTPLLLTSHGQALRIGSFLGADERRDLAARLRAALDEWRRSP